MGKRITLTAADGHEFGAYRADPTGEPKGAIVVVQEIFGVNHHIRSVVDRLAEQGYVAIAPALFDRIAPSFESGYSPEEVARARPFLDTINCDGWLRDTQAAIDAARTVGPVGIVGFCLGGSIAFLAATRLNGVVVAVGYYGGMIAAYADEQPRIPCMLHFGERDNLIPLADVELIRGKRPEVELFVYEGAQHGFNCDERASYHPEAAAAAWARTSAFFDRHLAGRPGERVADGSGPGPGKDRDVSVLIAGGGIGGLTVALALLRQGIKVTVLEQARELAEVGAGMQLSANATRLLISLGLQEAMEEIVCRAADKQIRHYRTGDSWPVVDVGESSLSRYGAPYWMVHRGDFHRVLVDTIQRRWPEALLTNARCVGFNQDERGVSVRLADGRTFSGDILVAADGIHSVIRGILFGDTATTFLGRAAWRGLVKAEKLPAHLRRPVSTNWIGPGGNAVTYPVRRGELINFVGAIIHSEWFEESWTARGSTEECIAAFEGWHEDIQAIIRNIDVPLKWAYRGREPLQQWTVGRVTLLGDAAHPTLPTLAQGACMAIEDAVVLARCLAQYRAPEALKRYEDARLERTSNIVRRSTENAKRFQDDALGDPHAAARYINTEWAPEKVAARYNWLYEYNAETVPV